LIKSYTSIFEAGLDFVATQIVQLLYEEGKSSSPGHGLAMSLTDSSLLAKISKSVNALVGQIDKDMPEALKKIVMASTCRAFALPSVFKAIKAGMELEVLLKDEEFIKVVLAEIRDGVRELFAVKAIVLAEQVPQNIIRQAASEFLTRLGLGEKDWRLDEENLVVNESKLFRIVKKSPTFWAGG